MTSQANPMSGSSESFEVRAGVPAVISATRPFCWSVRRELWENRFIYIAPLAVAGAALFAFSISVMLGIWERPLRLDAARPAAPFNLTASLLMLTGILVSVFYCLDALHGERRDRSILFWKSLPVSDLTTVLSKASIPLLVVPLLIFAVTVVMQWIMLLVGSAAVSASGQNVSTLWSTLAPFEMWLLLLYHLLTAHALWPAPIYCWLLLVSGWARRAAFLWAVLPVIVLAGVEQIAFHTSHFARMVGSRLVGGVTTAAWTGPNVFPTSPMTHISPLRFLSTPGLWMGLLVGAAFLIAAVRLRRSQGPI
jgi:ABC-2 type transport system permease protein